LDFAHVSFAEHIAFYAAATVCWSRRRGVERVMASLFAVAFGTSAIALLSTPGARSAGFFAVALGLLFAREAQHPESVAAFATTPRPRLIAMAAIAGFGLAYPGAPPGLPALLFSPFGILLHPTLLVALALANSVEHTGRALHWTLAASGLLWSIAGAASEGLVHAPLIVASAWAVPLALGKGRRRLAEDRGPRSVREIRDRMYSRWTLLPGPRDPRSRPERVRGMRR